VQPPGNGLAEPNPELERGFAARLGSESCAALFAGDDRPEHVVAVACRDHCRNSRGARHLRSEHLAAHPAAAELGSDADLSLAGELTLGDQLRTRSARGPRVHTLDLREKNEQPRANQDGDLSRKRIVVTERDLVGGRRVVLVDDRQSLQAEQLCKSLAGVDIGSAIGDVACGEQDLGRRNPVVRERPLPRCLQGRLTEGRGCLQARDCSRATPQPELREAERDCSGGDDADRLACADECSDLSRARV
jgi:hypothetical protein